MHIVSVELEENTCMRVEYSCVLHGVFVFDYEVALHLAELFCTAKTRLCITCLMTSLSGTSSLERVLSNRSHIVQFHVRSSTRLQPPQKQHPLAEILR